MSLSEYITHYLSAPDSTWSLVSLPFAITFIVFFGIYILVAIGIVICILKQLIYEHILSCFL